MCLSPSKRHQKGVKNTSATVLALGRNCKLNAAAVAARENRPLFFSKPNLVQNIGLCGNRRLPAAQLRKPHDKANLKRAESVCFF